MEEETSRIKRITTDCINLEEIDWQQAKKTSEDMIRSNKLQLDVNERILQQCNCRLNQLWELLADEEKIRRNNLESGKIPPMPNIIVETDEEESKGMKCKMPDMPNEY